MSKKTTQQLVTCAQVFAKEFAESDRVEEELEALQIADRLRELQARISELEAERDQAESLLESLQNKFAQCTAENAELQARIDRAPHDPECDWVRHIQRNGDPCEAPPCDCFKQTDGPGREAE
jgi:chromosome segregation ATPase